MSPPPIVADSLKSNPGTTGRSIFVDNEIKAAWWIATFIFVVAGLLTLARGPLPMWPFLLFWGLSLVFLVHVLREPAISVSVGDAEAVVTKHWPRNTRVERISLRELGPAVVIERDKYSEGARYEAAFALPGGRKVVFAADSNFEVVSREVERFRKQVGATEETS